MIVMNVEIDNFFAFRNFSMNMSYPKKIVDPYIEDEYLMGRTNFRYKKVNILMGANATGKTSLGRVLMAVFDFIRSKESAGIINCVGDTGRKASMSIDLIVREYIMYRLDIEVSGMKVRACTRTEHIRSSDNYERCAARLSLQKLEYSDRVEDELDKITVPEHPSRKTAAPMYKDILETVLKVLDPSVTGVDEVSEADDAYVIHIGSRHILIQGGETFDPQMLSSGTKAGIDMAGMISDILDGSRGFYYCDEKLSSMHSDVETALISLMIDCLSGDKQLFITTHNTAVLYMPLPKHAFTFLRKNADDEKCPIDCVCASEYIKKNTDILKNAVENDLFCASPDVGGLFRIADLRMKHECPEM